MDVVVSDRCPDQLPRYIVVLLLAALTPAGYLSYVVIVRWVQGNPLSIEPLLSVRMGLYFLVLTVTGGFVAWTAGRKLHWAPIATTVGLVVWPWLYIAIPVGNAGYAAVPLVGGILAASIETGIRSPFHLRDLWKSTRGKYILAAGLVHFFGGLWLQAWARTTTYLAQISPLLLIIGLGLLITGGLPVLLRANYRLITPALCTAGWFLWGIYGLWMTRDYLPRSEFTGIDWISLQPYPDYALQWTILLVSILLLSGCEYAARRLIRYGGWNSTVR